MNTPNTISDAEKGAAREWMTTHLTGTSPFFSFVYDGVASGKILPTWDRRAKHRQLDKRRTRHEVSYADRRTGLRVRCVAVEYRDFPVAEWTVYFKNAGKKNTPIVENIQSVDLRLGNGY